MGKARAQFSQRFGAVPVCWGKWEGAVAPNQPVVCSGMGPASLGAPSPSSCPASPKPPGSVPARSRARSSTAILPALQPHPRAFGEGSLEPAGPPAAPCPPGAARRGRGGRPARPLTKQGSPDGASARKPQRVGNQIFPSGGFGPAARPAPASPPRLPAREGCSDPPALPGTHPAGSPPSGWQRGGPEGRALEVPGPKDVTVGVVAAVVSWGVRPGAGVFARQGAPTGIWCPSGTRG